MIDDEDVVSIESMQSFEDENLSDCIWLNLWFFLPTIFLDISLIEDKVLEGSNVDGTFKMRNINQESWEGEIGIKLGISLPGKSGIDQPLDEIFFIDTAFEAGGFFISRILFELLEHLFEGSMGVLFDDLFNKRWQNVHCWLNTLYNYCPKIIKISTHFCFLPSLICKHAGKKACSFR